MLTELNLTGNQSTDETCPVLLPHTGVHTVILGVVLLSSWSVGRVNTYSCIMEVVCISVTLVTKYILMNHNTVHGGNPQNNNVMLSVLQW